MGLCGGPKPFKGGSESTELRKEKHKTNHHGLGFFFSMMNPPELGDLSWNLLGIIDR
jgi:hypothetical protein